MFVKTIGRVKQVCLLSGIGILIGVFMAVMCWSPCLHTIIDVPGIRVVFNATIVSGLYIGEILKPLHLPNAEGGDGWFIMVYGIVLEWTIVGAVVGYVWSCISSKQEKK
jgi:hypothetical protein